ncbi:MAG: hypothetical protein ABFC80_03805 [Coriobacteriales bacterium]
MYYKVLRDFQSCQGGNFDWSEYLPKGKRPGKWTPPVDDVIACLRGYHGCTAEQLPWWITGGNMVFEMEYRTPPTPSGNKVVGSQMRLLRRVGHGESVGGIVFALDDILHVSGNERCIAYGRSTIIARDASTVEAHDASTVGSYDFSTVQTYGRSTVRSHDASTVQAYDFSNVEAYDRSTVTANGSSTVTAYDSSTVIARGRSAVSAKDSSTVTAKDRSTVTVWSRYVRYEIYDSAVVIDRSDGKLTIHTA